MTEFIQRLLFAIILLPISFFLFELLLSKGDFVLAAQTLADHATLIISLIILLPVLLGIMDYLDARKTKNDS